MLATVLDNLDGLDEAVTKLYTETDGKFILALQGIDSHPDVANLKSAYERVKLDKTTAMSERDAFKIKVESLPSDFDAEKWAKLKDGKADEAALIKVRQDLEADRDEWKAKATEADSKLGRFAVERDLSDALIAAGITDAGLSKGARAMLSGMVKVDDNGKAIVESDMGPLALGEYVKKWAAGEGKSFVTPPQGGGRDGSNGAGGQVTKEQFAAMGDKERTELFNTDPETFRKLTG